MPELKRLFTSGKMNKDLDERLVPNGQYRDAQNIQVSDSEGSDVGAVESVVGNTKRSKKSNAANDVWQANFGLTNPVCIGVARDTLNNKVYWFITSDSCDAILEYDESTTFIAPILVDSGSILDFSEDNLITGVNVFEGLLAWTDDRNEPRIIKISTFKTATTTTIGGGRTLSGITTSVYGRSFLASDITVIKKKPNTAPTFTATASVRGGNGTGISPVKTLKNFTEVDSGLRVPLEVGAGVTITTDVSPNWQAGDNLVLTADRLNTDDLFDKYRVRLNVSSISGATVVCTVLSISKDIDNASYYWDCLLEEEQPMFELSFPRFAYRWKYKENEYSAFSPFTQAVFVPNDFAYTTQDAYNDGMANNLRKLVLNGFETPPKNVDKVEILYKSSDSNNIYKVDEIDPTTTSYTVTSELIHSVLPSNQLLRPYDNVPVKAKAQEVIGNRIVYGNYVQNYDISNAPDMTVALSSSSITTLKKPESSIKSSRTYQVGIVYVDENGRETPVFTNDTASINVTKDKAEKVNKLKVTSGQTAPSWATHFKYYVKDTSNEYYNLSLDRYYYTTDNNLWLSFPSAERNKVQVDDFIELKKEHDNDGAVTDKARYKVIDISNEAPESIRIQRKFVARSTVLKGANISGDGGFTRVAKGIKEFNFYSGSHNDNVNFADAFRAADITYIRFKKGSDVSRFYKLVSGGLTGEVKDDLITDNTYPDNRVYEYFVELNTEIKESFLNSLGNTDKYDIEIFQEVNKPKAEYGGRFFVKINRDSVIDDNVIFNNTNNPDDYYASYGVSMDPSLGSAPSGFGYLSDAYEPGATPTGLEELRFSWYGHEDETQHSFTGPPTQGSPFLGFTFGPYTNTYGTASGDNFVAALEPGQRIRFREQAVGAEKSKIYTIKSIDFNTHSPRATENPAQTQHTWEIELDQPFVETAVTNWVFIDVLERNRYLSIVWDEDSEAQLTSNPAIFETEPLKTAELNVYYEASDAIAISNLGNEQTLPYFNCYTFGNGVESNRIRDDFNAQTIGKGVRVSAVLEEDYAEERRGAGMIYSGIFNSTSGFNQLNQFIAAEKITKDLNPIYGTIQKLHARDTDLIVLLEDKIFRILANKDALYNADGNANLTATNRVLGQATPYIGEYGISKNPESFASYGFRAYFTDKARGAVIRLSRDGITDISSKGMSDYILDAYKAHPSNNIIGSFDEDAGAYNVVINREVLSFKENVDGWATRLSYEPESGISLNNEYYTFDSGEIYIHNNTTRSNFYGTQYDTTVTLLHNDQPSRIKNFKTLSYEGDDGWTATIDTDQQDGEVATWKNKEGIYYNYIRGLDSTWSNSSQSGTLDTSEFNVQGIDEAETVSLSADQTVWTIRFANDVNVSLQGWVDGAEESDDKVYFVDASDSDKVHLIGTCRDISGNTIKVSKDTNVVPAAGDFIFFAKNTQVNTSGIIGYYASVKMTKTGGINKELFAVNSEIFISS